MTDGTKSIVFSVVVTGLIVGGGFTWAHYHRVDALGSGPAELNRAFLARADKPFWVALETIEFSSEDSDETVWRLSAYDVNTGALVARKTEVAWVGCTPAGAGRLWCVTANDGLAVLAVPSLEELHPAAVVAQKTGQKLMDVRSLKTTESGALLTTLADGKKVELDPVSLVASPAVAEKPVRKPPEAGPFAGLGTCSIANSAREGFCRWKVSGPQYRVDTGDGYLSPERLPVEPVGGRMFIVAKTSLDASVAKLEFLALDEALTPQVRVPLGSASASVDRAEYVPEAMLLLLAFQAPEHTTVAIDLAKGAVRYRVHH